MMEVKLEESWKKLLQEEFNKEYFEKLVEFVKQEYKTQSVFPPGSQIFRALDECSFDSLKVVILGQDPYHTPGVANGLAFGAREGQRIPPSLLNIYKEIQAEFGTQIPTSPDLTRWARQGVLLLNTTLTVRSGTPMSHKDKGWELFTDAIIRLVSENKEHVVFMLWGAHAGSKKSLIDANRHLVLSSPHPSPFSADRGFFGNGHFKKANDYLARNRQKEIEW